MRLYCDNTVTIHIAKKSIFHECTKHIEVDCHLVRQKVTEDKLINLQHVYFINQLEYMLTKPLGGPKFGVLVISWVCMMDMLQASNLRSVRNTSCIRA